MTLVAGSLSGSDWAETESLARAIENAMVAGGILDLASEPEAAAKDRRKAFIAIATGIVTHLTAHLDLAISANALGTVAAIGDGVPKSAKTLTGTVH